MKHLIYMAITLAGISSPLVSQANEKLCVPSTTDLPSIVPVEGIVPGDYNLWNTNCGRYVFNHINQPTDASWSDPNTGAFINYGFAANTVTELESDSGNITVAAQINGWSIADSGVHRLSGNVYP